MSLSKIIPKLFYADISVGLHLFVECLAFKIGYRDAQLYILNRDNITLQLFQDADLAKESRPEIRIETDAIEAFYQEIKDRCPGILHPNNKVVKLQPWGLKEFALIDASGVCVIIQQPVN